MNRVRIALDPFPLSRYHPAGRGESEGRIVPGLGPRLADRLAQVQGVPRSSPERVLANTLMKLEDAQQDGHVCLPLPQLLGHLQSRLGLTQPELVPYFSRFERDGDLVFDCSGRPARAADLMVYRPQLYEAERVVASQLRQRLGHDFLQAEVQPSPALDPDQARALGLPFRQALSVWTGGPGRGKTHTLIALAREATRLGLPLVLMATTGRAASRLGEIAVREGVTLARAPGTVHRVLGHWSRQPPELPTGPALAVVDEASMLDLLVAADALRRLPSNYHLLFVGDSEQLPAVGPGTLFGDLVNHLPPE